MPTLTSCPKCRHIRQPHEQAPSWQCPACGVAYAKADDHSARVMHSRAAPIQPERYMAWGRWLVVAAVAFGAFAGIKSVVNHDSSDGPTSLSSKFNSNASGDPHTLAAAAAPGDVVIYSTSWCPNCKAAKQWMAQQGFAFTECDVEASASYAAELRAHYGSSANQGVPYLVVRGHHMTDGFDSEEFIAALRRR
jgi:glutaredoxin